MNIKLTALALAALVAAAPSALAQSTSCSKSTTSQASLAVAGDNSSCSAKQVAAQPVPLRTQLASLVESGRIAGLVVDGKTYSGCDATCVAEKLVRESLAAKISAHCEASAKCEKTLAASVETCLAKGVCAGKELASLVDAGRIQGVVIGEATLAGAEASSALAKIASCSEFQAECRDRMKAELAAATAAGEGSKACATLAVAGDGASCSKATGELAAKTGECAKSDATLASAGDGAGCTKQAGELAAKTGGCAKSACAKSDATLASAGDGAGCTKQAGELAGNTGGCSKSACAKADATLASAGDGAGCSKQAGELAAKTGECSKSASATLASAGGDAECSEMAESQGVASCAQLAALIHPTRVAGVVVDGKAYLGEKAYGVVWKLVEQDLAAKISANCAESAKCEKTLAANVQKTLNGGLCMKTELTALLAAGRIDSLIVDSESACGESAAASLEKITACPKFQAECRERGGYDSPAMSAGATSCAPIGVDVQVAALLAPSRITGIVVDGKSYQGAEAANVVASLVRENLATSIKEKCEASRACEKTLATNVDKAFAGGTCAGGQLASLVDSGRVQRLMIGDKELRGSEAKAAIVEIVSCETFRAECAQLASAKASKSDCSKPCDQGAVQ